MSNAARASVPFPSLMVAMVDVFFSLPRFMFVAQRSDASRLHGRLNLSCVRGGKFSPTKPFEDDGNKYSKYQLQRPFEPFDST